VGLKRFLLNINFSALFFVFLGLVGFSFRSVSFFLNLMSATAADTAPTLSDRLNPTHPAFDRDLKRRWGSMPKAERRKLVEDDKQAIAARHSSVQHVQHPFPTDGDDHCETGAECFVDVGPLLARFASCLLRQQRGKGEEGGDKESGAGEEEEAKASLRIYDPYYCTGAVVRHLGKLGFTQVYNRCEDFYAVAANHRTPEFEILLTNPAYSGDHIPRLLDFVGREVLPSGRAFALLLPAYVCAKDYYVRSLERHPRLSEAAFLCPRKRYVFWTPAGLRSKRQAHASALGNRTSPFVTFWYLHFGQHHQEVLRWWRSAAAAGGGKDKNGRRTLPDCILARTINELPKGVRPATNPALLSSGVLDKNKKRGRPEEQEQQQGEAKRKKSKKKKKGVSTSK